MKLHIYAQAYHHCDAHIVADAEGLDALIAACEQAKKTATSAQQVFTDDGEGYGVFVTVLETRDPRWEQLCFPYIDKEVTGKGGDLTPVDIMGTHKYRELHARMRANEGA